MSYGNFFQSVSDTKIFLSEYQKFIFKHICEYSINKSKSQIFIEEIILYFENLNIDENTVLDNINYFNELGFINKNHFFDNGKFVYFFFVTSAGFESYAKNNYPDFKDHYKNIYSYLKELNAAKELQKLKSQAISMEMNLPLMIVNFVLEKLYDERKILINQGKDENWHVTKVFSKEDDYINRSFFN